MLPILTIIVTHGFQVNAHDGSINCLAAHDSGTLVCLGRDDGAVSLVALSDGFVTSPNMKADKANLVTMLDRETRREKVLENMAKEARIRAATTAEQTKGMKSAVINVKMKSKIVKDGWPTLRLTMF